MKYETLLYEKEQFIATVTIIRPERMNAINSKLLEELGHIIDQIATDDEVRVMIITGGEKCFSAGLDLSELKFGTVFDARERNRAFHAVFNKIEDLEKPVIGAVSGVALGGGFELCLACDLLIASDTARLGLVEINLGALPGGGGTQRLPRLIGVNKAKEMIYSGETIDANEAYRLGLISKITPVDRLLLEAKEMAKKLADKNPLSLKAAKLLINRGLEMDLKSALEFELITVAVLASTEEMKAGVRAFLEKRTKRT